MTSSKPKALIIGEALIDIVVPHTGEKEEVCGGSPANVALGLARLGKPVVLNTWISNDKHGQLIEKYLNESGVKITHESKQADWTSTATATLDAQSNAHYEFKIQWNPPKTTIENISILHTGSIGATLEPGKQTVLETIKEYKNKATISYDPNIRPTIMGTREEEYNHIIQLAQNADIVKASHEDIQWLEPDKNYKEFAYQLLESEAKIVVITLAEKGVWVCTKSGIEKTYPTLASKVVDTVGAGDSFMAGIINGLWEHDLLGAEKREKLCEIEFEILDDIMFQACKIAAITVSRKGADLPFAEEI